MQGQWVGKLGNRGPEGELSGGWAVLDLDDDGIAFRGSLFFFDDRRELSGTYARVEIPKGVETSDITLNLTPLNRTGVLLSPEALKAQYPDTVHPTRAWVHLESTTNGLLVSFTTDIKTSGSGLLVVSRANEPSWLQPDKNITTWAAFRSFVADYPKRRSVFRGQPCTKRLRTCFHRSGRTDLVKYLSSDIQLLHRHLMPLTKHFFRLSDADELGAFCNLIQHHGFPTPLLDWSESPFIAAFFAFREKDPDPDENKKVRVFVFDANAWLAAFPQYDRLTYLPPHVSIVMLAGIENPRMIPQQGLSMLTNVDDIEAFIRAMELATSRTYLTVIDLPYAERATALADLRVMGITAASLFPGLDGSCEAMKGELFGH